MNGYLNKDIIITRVGNGIGEAIAKLLATN
jgi:hypothetical protein